MNTSRAGCRAIYDLTPQELHQLYKHNLNVSVTAPPARPSRAVCGSVNNYAFYLGIYERISEMHVQAKRDRSNWLKSRDITPMLAAQAVITDYQPFINAGRIGLIAPPEPEGYAQALMELNNSTELPFKKSAMPSAK